jgi:hypothetical protein
VADTDALITDADSSSMTRLFVNVIHPLSGDALSITGNVPNGLTVTGNGTPTLSISGTADIPTYQSLLRAIRFTATQAPTAGNPRLVQVTVSDGISYADDRITSIG